MAATSGEQREREREQSDVPIERLRSIFEVARERRRRARSQPVVGAPAAPTALGRLRRSAGAQLDSSVNKRMGVARIVPVSWRPIGRSMKLGLTCRSTLWPKLPSFTTIAALMGS